MHRSGTSLLARFIHSSGFDLGSELLGATPGNVYGHFEDTEILEFHRQILMREFGHQMWVPRPPMITERDRALARDIVTRREHKPRWGWKEPRTALFLDLWDRLVPHARYLFVVRDPLLVVDSLRRRTGTRWFRFRLLNRFLKAWLLYNRECYRFRINNPNRSILVPLENLVERPDEFTSKLSQLLGYVLDVDAFHASYDAGAIAAARHETLLVAPKLVGRAGAFYELMKETGDV